MAIVRVVDIYGSTVSSSIMHTYATWWLLHPVPLATLHNMTVVWHHQVVTAEIIVTRVVGARVSRTESLRRYSMAIPSQLLLSVLDTGHHGRLLQLADARVTPLAHCLRLLLLVSAIVIHGHAQCGVRLTLSHTSLVVGVWRL